MTSKLPPIALLCLVSTLILVACTATPTATTVTTTTAVVPAIATPVATDPTLPPPVSTTTTTTTTAVPSTTIPTTIPTTTTTTTTTTAPPLPTSTTLLNRHWVNPIVLGDWSFKVTDYDPDATQKILDEHNFNDEPGNDNRYVMVTVEVTNVSETKKPLSNEVGFQGMDLSGKVYEECEYRKIYFVPDGYDTDVELIPGSTSEGNICLEVANEVASSLRLVLAQHRHFGDDYAIVELSTTDATSSTTTTVIELTTDAFLLGCATEISGAWTDARNASLRVAESFAEDSRAAAEEVENGAWELISGATEALDCLLSTQPGEGPERYDEAFRQFRTGNTELPTTALLLGCATEISGTWGDAQLTALRLVEWVDAGSQAASDRMEGATVDLAVGVAETLDCLLGTQPGEGTGRIDAALQQLR